MDNDKILNNNNSKLEEATPLKFYLSQNFPNPFSDKTTIKYCIAYKTKVMIKIQDFLKNEIAMLVNEIKEPGTYVVEFELAFLEKQIQAGDYIMIFEAGKTIIKKLIYLILISNLNSPFIYIYYLNRTI